MHPQWKKMSLQMSFLCKINHLNEQKVAQIPETWSRDKEVETQPFVLFQLLFFSVNHKKIFKILLKPPPFLRETTEICQMKFYYVSNFRW